MMNIPIYGKIENVPNHQPESIVIIMMTNCNGREPMISLLVGGIPTTLKNMKVSWDDCSQYVEKNMFQTTNQFVSYYYLRLENH